MRLGEQPWACRARLWSGVVLFAFVLTHLLNHAVGIFGVQAMEAVQAWRWTLWKSPPGTVLLYGAALIHIGFATYRIVRRQTWRMPKDELWQIASGLAIPLLVAGHIAQTRVAGTWFQGDESYGTVLYGLWPALAGSQTVLLLVSWSHGIIGLHHAFRFRRWYASWRTAGLILAVLIPCLSLAGFVAGGREASRAPSPPAGLTDAQRSGVTRAMARIDKGLAAFGGITLALLAFGYVRRRAAQTITITYRGFGPVKVPRGTSVLEASRMHHIPHPSVCHGRGRCSTCRVHVLAGAEELTEPFATERALLARVGAPPNVRLGCQLRPTADVKLRILMPVLGHHAEAVPEEDITEWAVEREATVLCLDLRAFGTLTRSRLPYEIAVLVNRFSAEMTQVVESHGGRMDRMYGDGLLAVFEMADDRSRAARNAIKAARDMTRVLDLLNQEMVGALPIPIRAGIGIHTGPVVLARISDGMRAASMMAMGSTVTVAVGLETATKDLLVDCVISAETVQASKYDFAGEPKRELMIEGHDESVTVYPVADRAALQRITSRSLATWAIDAAGA